MESKKSIDKKKSVKSRSFKKTLQLSYMLIIGIMIIPTVYSITVSNVHSREYDRVITNVSTANRINQIAKEDLPNELWEIVCGKRDFYNSNPYGKLQSIFEGIEEMKRNTESSGSKETLEVANRACTTLRRNIEMLERQIWLKASVTETEEQLDEIRTVTSLFSDIMQDCILDEIESANQTNASIKKTSIVLSILQLVIFLLSFAVSLYGYVTLDRGIRNPLADMQRLSSEISQGNLSARIETPGVEELVPLARNMNSMAGQIDLLLKKNIEEQKNFQKAEMKALQAQITPHFLYNTFDTIIWLAEEEKTDDVIRITKAFSEFLRISLSRGHEWITVQQELDHIRNYLTIQKIRYNDILNYEIEADASLSEFSMIKLVLQPLVENAIYHGIKNKRGRGHLLVTASYLDATKQNIEFAVIDDGAGFTPERLEQVKLELNTSVENQEKLSSVYGLYNVHKKLKLYYGDRTEGLNIQSEKGKGCRISFVIPCSSEEHNV